MTEQQVKHKSGPVMKPAEEPTPEPAPEKTDEWLPMSEAPKDGSYVYLKEDTSHDEWFWYRTRQFRKGMWQEIGWWKRRYGLNTIPALVPTGFRRLSDGLPK
jgi:hypothetical protein